MSNLVFFRFKRYVIDFPSFRIPRPKCFPLALGIGEITALAAFKIFCVER